MNTLRLNSAIPTRASGTIACLLGLVLGPACSSQPDPNWLGHDRNRPQPQVIDPGSPSTQDQPGKPPSDAVILFDGKDISSWVSMDGSAAKWQARNGYMECVKESGYIRTLQNFGDCQLHIEWVAPTPAEGEGQGRGNSGVFFGFDRYEVQVLDSWKNTTYSDGSAASIYGQYPPLVNASRPPGQWQWYDIVFTAPRFDAQGKLLSPTRVTVFHNGVLVQNNVELTGPTSWLERAPYKAHPEKLPISLQDHGNPVRYRNIWVRELGKPGKREFTPPKATLESLVGTYEIRKDFNLEVAKADWQLTATMAGVRFVLFAESMTKFFAKTTDVTFEFVSGADGKVQKVLLSPGEGQMTATKIK